jgi:sarcosine oxidase subunit gamma
MLTDVTHFARIGLKGPMAGDWLQQRGIRIPDAANCWRVVGSSEEDIIVRLGSSEFLLEAAAKRASLQALADELTTPVSGVYPVLREDRALVLAGEAADEVLAQVCNVNFSALRAEACEAVMTLMIGVAVTVVPQGNAAQRRYRIWCDPSYGDYLWSSLQDVADPYLSDTTRTPGGVR